MQRKKETKGVQSFPYCSQNFLKSYSFRYTLNQGLHVRNKASGSAVLYAIATTKRSGRGDDYHSEQSF